MVVINGLFASLAIEFLFSLKNAFFSYVSKSGSGRCSDICKVPQSSILAPYPAFKDARLHVHL